jgi:hypothetical protein
MEFGTFTMKKFTFIVLFLFIFLYLGYKFYLINQIQSVVNNRNASEFTASQKIEFLPSEYTGEYEISTNLIKFKTSVKFSKNDMEEFNIRPNLSQYYWEKGDNYKSVFISNNYGKAGFLKSLNQQTNVNEFLGLKIESDYDLHSYCFALNHEDLNVFTPLHEIKIYSFCFVSRSIYMYNKGGVFDYSLPNKLKIIQMGSTGNNKVGLYFHNDSKELFSLMLNNFTTHEINLLLNTIEYHE